LVAAPKVGKLGGRVKRANQAGWRIQRFRSRTEVVGVWTIWNNKEGAAGAGRAIVVFPFVRF